MPRKSKEKLKNSLIDVTSEVTSKSKTAEYSSSNKNSTKTTSSTKKTSKNPKTTKTSSATTVASKTTKAVTSKINKSSAKKKSTTSKKTTKTKNSISSEIEYYDLPYRYNETVVKILAQTPTTLFIYWDISDDDKNSYVDQYGADFFSSTKPVLIITNKTMNYTFEVEINDFANSWYLHVNDPDCDYSIELGRRPIMHFERIKPYIYVATSNDMEVPNNHILFDKLGKSVFFKNVKNNFVQERDVSSISFIKNIGKYSIYDIYKELYRDNLDIEKLKEEDLKLNLSSSSSSTFK